MNGNALYKRLRKFFVLPTIRRLQQLSAGQTVNQCTIDLEYIKVRTTALSTREKVVIVCMDEIHTARRVEYQNGRIIGLTDDGSPAKTVLAIMVQSVSSKYKDIVYLAPIDSLTTEVLQTCLFSVFEQLQKIVCVVAVSVDNHAVNRSLYCKLCGGTLKPCIDHPFNPGHPLFLLFDTTHNMKNIYNNWVSKQLECINFFSGIALELSISQVNRDVFKMPDGYTDLIGGGSTAHFSHIKNLFFKEEHLPLKVAHKLKRISLNPNNIARTSPLHALS